MSACATATVHHLILLRLSLSLRLCPSQHARLILHLLLQVRVVHILPSRHIRLSESLQLELLHLLGVELRAHMLALHQVLELLVLRLRLGLSLSLRLCQSRRLLCCRLLLKRGELLLSRHLELRLRHLHVRRLRDGIGEVVLDEESRFLRLKAFQLGPAFGFRKEVIELKSV